MTIHDGELHIQKTVISRDQYEKISKEQGKYLAPISRFIDSSRPIEKLNEVEKKQIDQAITKGPGSRGVWCNIFNLVNLTWIVPISRVLRKIDENPSDEAAIRERERDEEFAALEETFVRISMLSEEEIQELMRNQEDSDQAE